MILPKLYLIAITLLCGLVFATSANAATLVARAGTTITLDITNLTSVTVRVLLDDQKLLETSVLGNNVGLEVPIPASSTTGTHTLTIQGVEQGEVTTKELVIIDGVTTPATRNWIELVSALVLGLFLGGLVSILVTKKVRR